MKLKASTKASNKLYALVLMSWLEEKAIITNPRMCYVIKEIRKNIMWKVV